MFREIKKLFFPSLENNYRPKILEGNFLFYWLILILFLKAILFPFYFYLPYSNFFAEIVKSVLIDLTNKTRKEFKIPPLEENPLLNEVASLKAEDMLLKNYFSHKSPEGFFIWDLLKKFNYHYKIAGENLAIGYLDADEVHQAWLASPSHRANILNPQFKEIGLAVSKGKFEGNDVYVVVQVFGTPKTIQKSSVFEGKDKQALLSETSTVKIKAPETSRETPTSVFGFEEKAKEEKPSFKFLKFLSLNYNNFVQKFIYGSLVFLILILLTTIFIKIDVQYPDLIFKTLAVIIIFTFFLWLDKEFVLQIIAPHSILSF